MKIILFYCLKFEVLTVVKAVATPCVLIDTNVSEELTASVWRAEEGGSMFTRRSSHKTNIDIFVLGSYL
jgi:hypothetical protein